MVMTGAPVLTNCTFSSNTASGGGGIYSADGALTIANSVLWGNVDLGGTDETAQLEVVAGTASVSYSTVQGLTAYVGFGNTGADPLFIDADGADDGAP